jgi:hypothetical protein
MWSLETPTGGATNKVVIPTDGMILVTVQPPSTKVHAYINDQEAKPLDRLYGRSGDVVYFDVKGSSESASTVIIQYGDNVDTLQVTQRSASMDVATSEPSAYTGTEINQGKIMNPMETVNLFANPNQGMGGALGGGLGAGLLGGILGGALLGRNGLNGLGGGVDGVVGPAATLQGVESVVNNAAIMQSLGDIKAAVPLAEGQIQLALAGAQMDLNNSISQTTASVIGAVGAGNSAIMANQNMQTQMNQKGFSDTAAAVVAQGTANLLATKDAATQALQSSWLLNQAVTADGDKTRALIQSIDKTNDSRLITQLANEVTELRNEGRLRGVEGNITISNTNTAQAVAQQQQSQQQAQQLAVLGAHLQALYQQNQHIQQGVLNIGSGTVSGNSQTAANTRVS